MKKRTVLGVDLNALAPPSLSESMLGTVPETMITQAVEAMMHVMEQALQRHVMQDMSKDPVQRSTAIAEANETLSKLRVDVTELIKDSITSHVRR